MHTEQNFLQVVVGKTIILLVRTVCVVFVGRPPIYAVATTAIGATAAKWEIFARIVPAHHDFAR